MQAKVLSPARIRHTAMAFGMLLGAVAADAQPVHIVIPPDPHPAEVFAAQEAQRYLAEMLDGPVTAGETAPHDSAVSFHVGRTAEAAAAGHVPVPRWPEDDAYRLVADETRVHAVGAGPRGTLFAVYDVLERMGCRWFAPGFRFYKGMHEYVPERGKATIPSSLDVRAASPFKYRVEFPEHAFNHEPDDLAALIDWCAKNRINTVAVRLNELTDPWYRVLEPECAQRDLMLSAEAHGFERFLSRVDYYPGHPEWFGPVHGAPSDRFFDQFIVTNEAALATFKENLRNFVERYPGLHSVSAMPNDSPRWTDPDLERHSPLELLFKMFDVVVKTIHDTNPRIKVSLSTGVAYFGDTGETLYDPPHDNVLFQTAVLRRTQKYAWNDPASTVNWPQYEVAAAATRKLRAQGHDVIWSSRYAPFRDISLPGLVYPQQMADELRDLAALGASGINFNYAIPPAWIPYELKHYLFARLAWDPAHDPEAILTGYYADRFPGAPESMTAFYTALRAAMERYAHPGGGYTRDEAYGRYPEAHFDDAMAELDAAQAHLADAMAMTNSDAERQIMWLLGASLRYGRAKVEIDRLAQSGQTAEAAAKLAETMDFLEAWTNRGVVYDSSFLRMGFERRFAGMPMDTPVKGLAIQDNRLYEYKDFGPDGQRLPRPGGPPAAPRDRPQAPAAE